MHSSEINGIPFRSDQIGQKINQIAWDHMNDEDKDKTLNAFGWMLNERLSQFGEALVPGDELVARLELDSNRMYEYVHLRDERPATAEPVDLLSGYRWQGGIGFYQATGDVATNYYIDQLPQGRFVLETSFRVRQRGVFTSGLASVQCLYAPEFGAHSAASVLTVVAPK